MTRAATADQAQSTSGTEHVDVLIIGAGVSGIGAAHRLRTEFPERSFVMLEAQDARGGTWWTHRFPGARSDSDLFTYGYRHKPWRGASIAAGDAILEYLDEVIEEDDLTDRIRYHHKVTALDWSSEEARWTARVLRTDTGEEFELTASFLWMCQGYYNHDEPYTPEWPGTERFEGTIVHPQGWPSDLDHAGKKVVVIGSGSTAATVVPALAQTAEHVTMLQRSPSYWFPAPTVHELATMLAPLDLPADWTHEILRRQYVQQLDWLATTGLEDPDQLHAFLVESIRPLLPEGTDIEKHFTPSYRPWQQRIAFVPDGDLFAAMREGKAAVVTDTITEFTEKGVQVSSGEVLEADVVVTATGFDLSVFGDIPFRLDGEPVDFSQRVTWRGIMISGVPNMAYAFGYFRHSWTLRVDLVNDVVGRIFERMAKRGASTVLPTLRPEDEGMPLLPWSDPNNFNPGYVLRSQDRMFKQSDRDPWTHMHEHDHERVSLPEADIDDGLQYR
ncbi:NAD(P)/FAD-dependent oxidoreductase [Pseudonocardia sp. KRD-184]|uniref:NAD(P)/FAD-dependent oxidoreductase n=1 Tax=Pseudonocardia oceani TaxID=2792013 RepID=A0ABS6U830_9PSEU|nr:NAD(P)/FAD-dependent oxidoreductase [Pseudonocardia oceani]MBW0088694.1 NAD(P)/FAD-dependent oxidoreductase [Pseudonocardia oceani]MBW0095571.1 NAD(P)/FAD-dependent oxidoreductase [Pseudonocardia oceani]MBW0110589.1 NAD(P)/FAD-dependent oxidoreductase [Pseudonocardia oceani]MBW0120672.1 NAD(P)/FAD-dependent oxidoreductase [Pseudonocardia oceani]MBW0128394.1 NAD(P)/FAD-dependent oxidoreductase [Pseudonocardia oceani]